MRIARQQLACRRFRLFEGRERALAVAARVSDLANEMQRA